MKLKKAIFLDRDGVLIEDNGLLVHLDQVKVLGEAPEALLLLKQADFFLCIVSNQAVVARGLLSEAQVVALNKEIEKKIFELSPITVDGFYFCPHHPNATLIEYRKNCECRKPKAGLILQAAQENDLDLKASYMIGDRITDIIAGAKAGTKKNILVKTGRHQDPPIESADPLEQHIQPDQTVDNLYQAALWILKQEEMELHQ